MLQIKLITGGCIMQLKLNTKQFTNAVKNCSVNKKPPLPILQYVMLKAENGMLSVYGTDLEVYTSFTIPAEVKEEGVVLINHKKLTDLLKAIKDKEITLTAENGYLFVNNTKLKIDLEPDDFLLPEDYPSDLAISINSREFFLGINKTTYAISKDDSRFSLNGVCFSFIQDKLDFVATDGHRLALYSTDKQEERYNGKYVIPKKIFKILKNLVKNDANVNVEFAIKKDFVFFKLNGAIIQVRLEGGVYPDYYQVIPKEYSIKLTLPKINLIEAIKDVVAIDDRENKPIIFSLSENKLIVETGRDIKRGEELDFHTERVISTVNYNGKFQIAFNGNYILEALTPIEDLNIIFKFTDKLSQAVITPENPEERYIAVVMPMELGL
jgi:DNA polymerase-3 subunit beta